MISIHSWWQHDKQAIADIPVQSNIFQLVLEDPEAYPKQMRYLFTPACSQSIPRSPCSRSCPENLQREAPQIHKPPQLTSFHPKEQLFCSDILIVTLSSATPQRISIILAFSICDLILSDYQELMTIGK